MLQQRDGKQQVERILVLSTMFNLPVTGVDGPVRRISNHGGFVETETACEDDNRISCFDQCWLILILSGIWKSSKVKLAHLSLFTVIR